MRDSIERLRDVQEAISNILKYTNGGKEAFLQDELVQVWVIRHLEIIGESLRSLPQDFKNSYPQIPWKEINGMRNILVHLYFDIKLERIWAVIEHDLMPLKSQIDAILRELE